MNQDARNSVRYAASRANLDALAVRLFKEARSAAATGDETSILHFSALVNEQISSEHREWIDFRSVVPNLSLDRLAERALPLIGSRDSRDWVRKRYHSHYFRRNHLVHKFDAAVKIEAWSIKGRS